jgi:hypothetical protein
MFSRKDSPHPVDTGGQGAVPATARPAAEEATACAPGSNWRACCCPAPPRVRVFVPLRSALGRPDGEIDILLCAHHYRASLQRLDELGVVALGMDGSPAALFGPSH